jgi:tetratricopeptide (TPR) repeat protein
MNLAGAYEATGDISHARDAFEHAQAVYPLSAQVDWNYGNFLLREQQWAEGYAQTRLAVRADPSLLPLAISRTWRSNHDVDTLLNQVLPADANAYLRTLDFFASIHEAEAGLAVWQRLMSLAKPIALPQSFSFLDELIREDRSADANRVWREALRAAGLPHEDPGNGSLIWDGNFTGDFPNGGLGWRWDSPPGASIDFDSAPPMQGGRSVRLDFGGGVNLELDHPLEYVPVEPNRTYHFRAYLRTAAIPTESGMRFAIADPNHAEMALLETENLTGDHSWTAAEADVATGAQTHFLVVRLYRSRSRLFDNRLSGTAWIADVSLVPTGADASGHQQ